jgi:predicted anti-sigma-YlaC factor YlaD
VHPDEPSPTMGDELCPWWEQVSAMVDGELTEADAAAASRHAGSCTECRGLLRPSTLRSLPVSLPATPLRDESITPRDRRWISGRWTRRLLTVAALVIVAEAVPAYIRGRGLSAESHAARHLASWQIGFGVGLLVAALMARMSHAMLALAATFATLTVTATVIDVIGGHRGPWAESVHLVELIGVYLLWRATPSHLLAWRHTARGDDAGQSPSPERTELRVVHRDQR